MCLASDHAVVHFAVSSENRLLNDIAYDYSKSIWIKFRVVLRRSISARLNILAKIGNNTAHVDGLIADFTNIVTAAAHFITSVFPK